MGNQIYGYDPFEGYGTAKVLFYDATRDAWDDIGLVESPSFSEEVQSKSKSRRREGKRVNVETRQTGSTAMLSFTWKELYNPRGNQRIFGDKTTSQTALSPACLVHIHEREMYQDDQEGTYIENFAPFEASQANYTRLPAPASFTATVNNNAGGTFAGFAANPDLYAWAVPVHVDPDSAVVPTNSTICDTDKLDDDWCFGAPFDYNTGTAGYAGTPIDLPDATSEIVFTGTAPTHGPTPDYVAIFVHTADNLAAATCWQLISWATFVGAGSAILTEVVGGDTYVASVGASFYVDAGSYETPSLTRLTVDTDITWDNVRAAYKLKGGDYNGRMVRGKFFYVRTYGFSQDGGPTGITADYRKVMFICQEPQVNGEEPLYAEGDTITFFKVNLAGNSARMSYTEDDWQAGMPVEFPVEIDPANSNKYFTRTVESKALRSLNPEFYR